MTSPSQWFTAIASLVTMRRRAACALLSKALVVAAIVSFGTAAFAAPAAWYKWRSKLSGIEVCAQTSPGDGWEKMPASYKNANCS